MPSESFLATDQEMRNLLNEASEALFSSLTMEDELIFDELSKIIVPRLADWFIIDLYDDKQGFEMLTIAHENPAMIQLVRKLRQKYPPDSQENVGLTGVIKSGKPEIYTEITPEMLRSSAKDDMHYDLLLQVGFQSVIILPLKARNIPFGTITFISSSNSERRYGQEDLPLMESFANKIAIAIENKKLYSNAQKEIARRKASEVRVKSLLKETKLKQKWLDDFVQTIPGMVWETRLNPDGSQKMIFISEYAEKMLGYPQQDWYKVPNFWQTIIHPEDNVKTVTNAIQTFKKGHGQNQYRWISKSGNIVWTETRSFVLYDEKKQPIGLRGVTFDITRLKELEQRRDEFLGIASHELKTPITSAKIIAQCLMDSQTRFASMKDELIKKLDQQLDKVTGLIDSMLDVNRLQENRMSFNDEAFDINALVHDIVETFQVLYSNPFSIEGAIQTSVVADKERIGQVIINFLTNAVKYSDKDKPILLILLQDENEVSIKVKDQGVGIDPQYLQRIFERFFRVPDPSIKYISGMGIGLNICYQIINQYKGKIWAESTPGQGSTFCFSLPIAGS